MGRPTHELEDPAHGQRASETAIGRLLSGVRLARTRTNLAAATTSFVGRASEKRAAMDLVLRGRVVSVVGPPGTGKSRVVRETALGLFDTFAREGGAWWVDLADAHEAGDLHAALARALGVELGTDPQAQLVAALGSRNRLLVVLDAAERVGADVARFLEASAAATPRIAWLVGSRIRLGAPGESVLELGPMSLPEDHEVGPDSMLDGSDAMALFVERAGLPRSGALRGSDAIARLVRQLGGNALAIELAAARARANRLRTMPTPSSRHVEPLRGSIEASWSKLGPPLRSALAHASVFVGGFESSAAADVFGVETGDRAEALLDALCEAGLVFTYSVPWHARRFGLHASIRDFAWARLGELGAREAALDRHARAYLAVGRQWRKRMDGAGDAEGRGRIEMDLANILAVHRRSLPSAKREDAIHALEAALIVEPVLSARGPAWRALALVDAALTAAAAAGVEGELYARAVEARARALRSLGRDDAARAAYEEARDRSDPFGGHETRGRALIGLGALHARAGRLDEARTAFESAMRVLGQAGDRQLAARALGGLGELYACEGRVDRAGAILEESMTIAASLGDWRCEVSSAMTLARARHATARLDDASVLYERVLKRARDAGDVACEADATLGLALAAHEAGRHGEAHLLYAHAIERFAEQGRAADAAASLAGLAGLLVDAGELEEARARYAGALSLAREAGDKAREGFVLGGMGALEAIDGALEAARAALGRATECLRESAEADRAQLSIVEVNRGHLDLLIARVAREDGERARAEASIESARQRLVASQLGSWTWEVSVQTRLALARLRHAVDEHEGEPVLSGRTSHSPPPTTEVPPPASTIRAPSELPADTLVVSTRGRWFRPPFGPEVDLARWRTLQSLVERFAEQREIAPGQPLTIEDLIQTGWPGERVLPKAGATRVYTALSTLRRLGLRDVLVRSSGGYLLRADVPLVRVAGKRDAS